MNTPRRTPRLLLVDDDNDFLEVNALALKNAGFEVVIAHDGKEGFEKAQAVEVDLAVLDVMMNTPDEGFELARKLRANDSTKNIPLIMLSSVNESRKANHGRTVSDRDRDGKWMPFDRFLEKPLTPDCLVPAVCEMLSAKR